MARDSCTKNDRWPQLGGAGVVAVGREGLAAGAVAAVLSGAPSTAHALLTGRDVIEPARAAGTLLLADDAPSARLLAAGAAAHTAISLGWGVVLAALLRGRMRSPAGGALAGLAIAALDLGVVARALFPRIRALPGAPQVADHLAYGALVGAVLQCRCLARSRS